jgi:integrase
VRQKIDAGYSVQTAVHVRNALSAVFNHAKLKRAYSGDNPAQGVRMPEMKRRESHALTFEQARMLLDRLRSPSKEMALLSMMTSLNVAEMLGLRWKRINLTDQAVMSGEEILPPYCLAVRENYYRGEFGSVKVKSRRRIVPLSAAVVTALAEHRERSGFAGPDDLMFCTGSGKPVSERNLLRGRLEPVGRELGMPWLSWQVFRHTHATFGEQIGMTLSDRQAQMGHGDARMTMHYTHSDLDRRRESIEAMQQRLLGLTAA